jgi:hypothetical protein
MSIDECLTDPKNPRTTNARKKRWSKVCHRLRLHRANETSPRAAHCIATSSPRLHLHIA